MFVDKNSFVTNSLSIPSKTRFVAILKSKEEIIQIDKFSKKHNLPLFFIGEGTNILPKTHLKAVIAKLETKGIEIKNNNIVVQAGERWDDVVKFAVSKNLSGIEPLSWIPGKACSAPIQNIGAYGTEISNYIKNIEVYDRKEKIFKKLKKSECEFEYRNSIFKKNPKRFIVVSINLKLSRNKPKIPKYKDIEEYFKKTKNASPSLKEIRAAIIKIRKSKLPDPKIIPNAGSYFTNPIIEKNLAIFLKNKFPEMPQFPSLEKVKVSAGWLIEKTGLKGKNVGKMKIYAKNALVLTNPNKVDFGEIIKAEKIIKEKVFKTFGIKLEREPVIIS